MDGWWHERYDKYVVGQVEELDGYKPLPWVTKRAARIVEMCRITALGRDTGHLQLGYSCAIGKRLRSQYFMLLRTYRYHNEQNERGWDLPDWEIADDVPGKADKKVMSWSAERFLETDVSAVRSALSAHLALLDRGNGVSSRVERKLQNRTLFLVGAEAEALYKALTQIPTATRTERRRRKAVDGPMPR